MVPFFDFSTASGLNGKIPVLANPALMFDMEKDFSNGPFTTDAKSRFETKIFLYEAQCTYGFIKIIFQ